MKHFFSILALVITIPVFLSAQQSPLDYGKVIPSDFNNTLYPNEKGAEAIVLLNYLKAEMINESGFKIKYTRHVRIRILKSSGYDYANISIPYSKSDQLIGLEACTHNFENGETVSIDLSKKDFISENIYGNEYTRRFTFPQVREGSIIEYTYSYIESDIWQFVPFTMQKSIPVRHAEFLAVYPDYFVYNINRSGFNYIEEIHSTQSGYVGTMSANFNVYLWTGRNLPAFQPEPYLPAMHEYLAGLSFELAAVNFPNGSDEFASPTYNRFSQRLMLSDLFGKYLNSYLLFSGEVKKFTAGANNQYEKMEAIYNNIRNYMSWNGNNSFMLSKNHKDAYKDKNGNSADINLMLVNMLRTAGINADPVILSTINNGTLNRLMAYDGNFDYVVCLANIDGEEYLLDATNNYLPMGYLPYYCLNGEGWVVNEEKGRFVNLRNEEKDFKTEYYRIQINEDGSISGNLEINYEGYSGYNLKKELKNIGDEYLKAKYLADYANVKFTDLEVTGLQDIETPLNINFGIETGKILQDAGEIVFFSPSNIYLSNNSINPFVKEYREFPVNLGCPEMIYFIYLIEIPENLSIDEIPETIRLVMPDNAGRFTFSVTAENNTIHLQGQLQINKTYFTPEEYPALREFYTLINQSLNKMIILKRNDNISQL